MCTGRRGRAGSTATKPTPRCGRRTHRPGSSPSRPNPGRSTRTGRRPPPDSVTPSPPPNTPHARASQPDRKRTCSTGRPSGRGAVGATRWSTRPGAGIGCAGRSPGDSPDRQIRPADQRRRGTGRTLECAAGGARRRRVSRRPASRAGRALASKVSGAHPDVVRSQLFGATEPGAELGLNSRHATGGPHAADRGNRPVEIAVDFAGTVRGAHGAGGQVRVDGDRTEP